MKFTVKGWISPEGHPHGTEGATKIDLTFETDGSFDHFEALAMEATNLLANIPVGAIEEALTKIGGCAFEIAHFIHALDTGGISGFPVVLESRREAFPVSVESSRLD